MATPSKIPEMTSPRPFFRARPHLAWSLPRGTLALGEQTLVMGIVNVTPDSFSDGGRYQGTEAATQHGLRLLDEGADLLDLGAESTRPGAVPLTSEAEQARLLPVLRELRRLRPHALLSVDTYHAATARAALTAGADVINDVSGLLWDPAMAETLAQARPAPAVVLMHTRGRPTEWARLPSLNPQTVVHLVVDELRQRLTAAQTAGIATEALLLDPGFGFGKRGDENLHLLAGLSDLHALARPLLVGISRKGFLMPPESRNEASSEARLEATIAGHTAAILAGAHILRVHDVPAARSAASLADRLLQAQQLPG